MSKSVLMIAAAILFLVAAAAGFYRLMFGFPIVIAGQVVGQVASFFAFTVFAGLGLACFTAARRT